MWALKKGDYVEATMPGRSSTGPFIPAVILRPPCQVSKSPALVKYSIPSLPTDYVEASLLRPVPPPELRRLFRPDDLVDAFRTHSWHCGSVSEVLNDNKYSILLDASSSDEEGEMIVCDQFNLRLHRDWNPLLNTWNTPQPQNQGSSKAEHCVSECESKNKLPMKFKFVFGKRKEAGQESELAELESTSAVEVTSSQEGYEESWYAAKLIGSLGINEFLVEYQALVSDNDGSQPYREIAEKGNVRPNPPRAQTPARFERLHRVDARYNDGWWEGVVSQVQPGGRYTVYFRATKEELTFTHSDLRPHHDWISGKWSIAFAPQVDSSKWVIKNSSARDKNLNFRKGTPIEVKSDEEGYKGAWYAAIVVDLLGNDKFTVEYQTLKTEDEAQLLQEVATGSDLRPIPPRILRVYPYILRENVDCWFNDGWWVGWVSKVLAGRKYVVYFSTSNEELEFDHYNMRPHQEWVNDRWVFSHMLL